MKEALMAALREKRLNVEVVAEFEGPRTRTYRLMPRGDTWVRNVRSRLEDISVHLGVPLISMRMEDGSLVMEVARSDPQFPKLFNIVKEAGAGDYGEFVLGKNNVNRTVKTSLRELPHLLVAGTTGSGKSVALHSIITGLLATHGANALRLMLIDPKRLEMQRYAGLPHLASEICYEAQKASLLLQQLIVIMEARYSKLQQMGLTDAHDCPEEFPLMLLVVDEYADLLADDDHGIEDDLIRLAQKCRAASIHLILATQRPSVDVLTGRLKANFPARLALRTASGVDSRVILDCLGADKLLGKGDALFSHEGNVVRLQVPSTTAADAVQLAQYYA